VFRGRTLTNGGCRVIFEDGVLEDLDGLLVAVLLLGLLGSRREAQWRQRRGLIDLGCEIDLMDLGDLGSDLGRRVRDRGLLYAERKRVVGVLWNDVNGARKPWGRGVVPESGLNGARNGDISIVKEDLAIGDWRLLEQLLS
jgi:hypothetical protein